MPKARPEQWAIEMGGPQGLVRQGWTPKTLRPGMKVKTVIHPLRDGSNGGQFMAVTLPDGTQMGNPNAAPSANAGAGPARTATPTPADCLAAKRPRLSADVPRPPGRLSLVRIGPRTSGMLLALVRAATAGVAVK